MQQDVSCSEPTQLGDVQQFCRLPLLHIIQQQEHALVL